MAAVRLLYRSLLRRSLGDRHLHAKLMDWHAILNAFAVVVTTIALIGAIREIG